MPGAALVFLIAFFAIETHVRAIYSEESYYVDALLVARRGAVRCLVLGDSHAAAGFRGELKNCANLAAGGMNLLQVYDVYQSVQLNNQIDLLIVTLGPQQFSAIRQANRSRVFADVAKEWQQGWNPLIVQPLIFERWLKWLPEYYLQQAGSVPTQSWQQKTPDARAQAAAKRLDAQKIYTPMPVLETDAGVYLQKLLSDASAKGINICVVRPAVTPEYADAMQAELSSENWQTILRYVQAVNVPFVDFQQLQFFFTDADFSNEDHLNPAGAQKFAPAVFNLCQAKISEIAKSQSTRF